MKLVIDRQLWLRGEGSLHSALIRASDRKQCCLGFLGEALGIPREKMLCNLAPGDIRGEDLPKWTDKLLTIRRDSGGILCVSHTALASELMKVNDESDMSATQREEQLTQLFKLMDVQVEFIN